MRDYMRSQGWKYALVAVAAFLIGSAAVVSAAGPIKLFALSDESGARVADVTVDGELLVNAMGSEVTVTNLPVDGEGRVLVTTGSPQPQLFTLFDNVTVNPLDNLLGPYINVEGFSQYKLFARNFGPAADGSIQILPHESLDGVLLDNGNLSFLEIGVSEEGHQVDGTRPYNQPFIFVRANVRWINLGGSDPIDLAPQTVSVFLYAVP